MQGYHDDHQSQIVLELQINLLPADLYSEHLDTVYADTNLDHNSTNSEGLAKIKLFPIMDDRDASGAPHFTSTGLGITTSSQAHEPTTLQNYTSEREESFHG
jgi:hypothetical protein